MKRDELGQVLISEPLQSPGRWVTNSKENYQELGELALGTSVKLTVSAVIGELTLLSRTDSVHMLGVQTRSNPPEQDSVTVGWGRVFTVAAKKPLQASTVAKLATRPILLDGTDFQDSSSESGLMGGLPDLLTAAEKPGVYTLLDSFLLVEAQVLAGEHTVAGRAAPLSEAASNFVKRINNLINTGRVMRPPSGGPSLAWLHTIGDLGGFEAALERSETTLKAAGLGVITDMPLAADLSGNDSQDLMLTLALHSFRKVFGSSSTSSGEIITADHSVKARAPRVFPLNLPGIGPESTLTDAQISGRRLVEELLDESPVIHMVHEIASINRMDLLAGSETTAPLPEPSGQVRYEAPARQIAPWPELRSQMQGVFDSTQFLEELTGTDRTALNAATAARAFDSAFHSEQEVMELVNAALSEKLAPSTIRLNAANQFVMGSDINNSLAMTGNPSPITARVRVRFVSGSPNWVQVTPFELVTLDPGKHRTVGVSPLVTSNGVVMARVQLTVGQGTVSGSVAPVETTVVGLG